MTQNWSQIYNLIKFFFEFWLWQVAQNWESNWNLIGFSFCFTYYYIYRLDSLQFKTNEEYHFFFSHSKVLVEIQNSWHVKHIINYNEFMRVNKYIINSYRKICITDFLFSFFFIYARAFTKYLKRVRYNC